MLAMTSTPPAVAVPRPMPPDRSGDSAAGGVEPSRQWHIANCHRCGGEEFAEPFVGATTRDDWAAKHCEATGHTVILGPASGLGPSVVLKRTEDGDHFRTLCTGEGFGRQRWSKLHDTPQLALANAREHVCGVAR